MLQLQSIFFFVVSNYPSTLMFKKTKNKHFFIERQIKKTPIDRNRFLALLQKKTSKSVQQFCSYNTHRQTARLKTALLFRG